MSNIPEYQRPTTRIHAQVTGMVRGVRVYRGVTLDIDPTRTDHSFGAHAEVPQSRVFHRVYNRATRRDEYHVALVVTSSIRVMEASTR